MRNSFFYNASRGLSDMPHVGDHPGVPILWILSIGAGLSGFIKDGLIGSVICFCAMMLFIGIIVLISAANRAGISDQLEYESQRTTQIMQ